MTNKRRIILPRCVKETFHELRSEAKIVVIIIIIIIIVIDQTSIKSINNMSKRVVGPILPRLYCATEKANNRTRLKPGFYHWWCEIINHQDVTSSLSDNKTKNSIIAPLNLRRKYVNRRREGIRFFRGNEKLQFHFIL